MIIAGGDEAGRGAVIGPLVVSVVSISDAKVKRLARMGVRDSKLLTRRKREFLYDEIYGIAEDVKVYPISNNEINEAMNGKISLNELEAMHFAKLIDAIDLELGKIYLDSPDVISERFGTRISLLSQKALHVDGVKGAKLAKKGEKRIHIISEHKADLRYPVVSSASIIAKVTRDRAMDDIEDRLGMEVGSGYPSDHVTVDAIRACLGTNKIKPFVREYWKTLTLIRQMKIGDYMQ